MFSCGRVKAKLRLILSRSFAICLTDIPKPFENADVTASIYYESEHAHGSLGITQVHFACLLSFIEARRSRFACSSVFVWAEEIFEKASRVDADNFRKSLVFLKGVSIILEPMLGIEFH